MKSFRSKIINRYEDCVDIHSTDDRMALLLLFGMIGFLISLLIWGVSTKSEYHLSGYWVIAGAAAGCVPYALGLLEIMIRHLCHFARVCCDEVSKILSRILSSVQSKRIDLHRKKMARLSEVIYAGNFKDSHFEPFDTGESRITSELIDKVAVEVFTDQLGRSLMKTELVRVIQSEILSENEALTLITLEQRNAISNNLGAVTNSFKCITIGLRLKLFPEHRMLRPELTMKFPDLLNANQMWSIFHEAALRRRQMDATIESVYEETTQIGPVGTVTQVPDQPKMRTTPQKA